LRSHKKGIAKTGVIGIIENNGCGKTVALRADMDALRLKEQNTVEYASKNMEYMHACGHDAHTAILLGAAEILIRMRDHIKGSIKFIFQPAEEGLGGARYMVDEGVLENPAVNAIIAFHVNPSIAAGSIAMGSGPVMASPGEFKITINGKGGHAAQPHHSIDPIITGANLVTLFQTILTREKDPLKNALISVMGFNAGTTYNIIPDTAVIKGTVRTFDPALESFISNRMEEMVRSLTKCMGAQYEYEYTVGYPPVFNHAEIVKQVACSASKIIGSENVKTDMEPSMLAEDFAYYTQKVPGAIISLGCRNNEERENYNLHSSRFDIDEKCLAAGMEIMARFALDYLS